MVLALNTMCLANATKDFSQRKELMLKTVGRETTRGRTVPQEGLSWLKIYFHFRATFVLNSYYKTFI